MKKRGILALLLCVSLLFSGCSALLEREYSSLQPHTSQSWDGGAVNQMNAENPEELQEAVLSLVSRYRQTGTVRLNKCADETTAESWVSTALLSLQEETGLGSYAVDYVIYTIKKVDGGRRSFDVDFQISFRRTEEQVENIYYATNVEAVTELLANAVDEGRSELAVHFSSFAPEDYQRLEEILREGLLPPELQSQDNDLWQVTVYPNEENPVVIEILLKIL